MTRSLSRLAFGDEKKHLELRCRIISELCLNQHIYLDEDYASLGCTFGKDKVLPWIAVMSDCFDGEDTSDPSAVKSIFEKETFKATKLGEYLGIWHLLAAANVLKCSIVSFYPDKGPKKFQALFGRAMLPYHSSENDEIIHVMLSSSRSMTDEHRVANHIVPLVKTHK
ncbi:vertnin [Elysia marginata]|uniref:Vertnin n=1 Tax=Elysia marginata TaxID=1093978 RepID=A0AAV4ERB3_9GAST|nr:vertnin [Elysia marginata]